MRPAGPVDAAPAAALPDRRATGRRSALHLWAWRGAYTLITLGPLLLALIDLDPGRGFWVNLSVAAGFVALALMGLQFVLAARWPRAVTPFGADVVLQVHRQVTVLVVVLVLAHPVVLFAWDHRFLALLDVVGSPWRARLAVLSVVALLALVVTSVWRGAFRLSYPAWQALHAALALVAVVAALAHVLMIGYYVDQPWERVLWLAYSGAFVWITVWVRLVKPVARWRRRLRVVEIGHEPGHSHALTLEPVSDSAATRAALAFAPGQFAWLLLGRSPFALTYHPFSYASSAERPEQPGFVVRAYGEFTSALHDVRPGTTVYLDGPWGHFSPDRVDATGWVLVAGGIGITPMLSILLTRRDRGDTRPVWLFHAVRDEEGLVARATLEEIAADPAVTVVPVLSRPGEGWTGERGRLDTALLRRHLPGDTAGLHAYVCGPPAMTGAACTALVDAGIDGDAVHSERFAMV